MLSSPVPSESAACGPQDVSGRSIRPLVVTGDAVVLDDVLRLAAAAGVEPEVAHDAGAARPAWPTAELVVVGADLVADVVRMGLRRRSGIVVVGVETDSVRIWEQAVAVGAERVVFLPDAEHWLVNRLADAAETRTGAGLVVCTLGGRGGAGATTLAVALAVTGMRRGWRCLLLDADALGGGIDLMVGGEHMTGPRWPDLAGTRGRLAADVLLDALPRVDGLTILSWDRGDRFSVPAEAMDAVLGAASRGADLVVVDLPRRLDEASELALARSDIGLLVVPAEVRATAAAGRVAATVAAVVRDLRVVVRGPAPSGLSADVLAGALGLPLAGVLHPEPGLAKALERGEPPARRGRGPLAEFCRDFLDAADGHRSVVAA